MMLRLLLMLISLWLLPALTGAQEKAEEKADEKQKPSVEYLETPKFTINLAERRKYLLVNVRLMVEGAEAIEKVKKNMPAIRNALIMLYSGLSSADLQNMEQREALRLKTKEQIQLTLDQFAKNEGFKDVFFTEFFVN